MQAIDLPEGIRAELLALFHRLLPDREVWAYGSRLNGTSHPGSDLDLVVRDPADPRRPLDSLWRLREAIAESNIPILVDVLDWASIPESFRDEIARSHILLYPPRQEPPP